MSFEDWITWLINCITSAYNWLLSISISGVPVLYILLAIIIIGVVLNAILYKV